MYRVLCLPEIISRTYLKSTCFNASRCLQYQYNEKCVSVRSQRCSSSQPDFSLLEKVYAGTLATQIKRVKIFSLSSSIGGILSQPYLLQRASEVGGTPLTVAMFGIVGFFTFVTPILLHLVTKRYVFELHYDPKTDKYTAVIMNFFLVKKFITFSLEEVRVPDEGGMLTSFLAKGTPLFVEPSTFETPHHYARLMGYDKPLDLKLGNVNEKALKGK